MANGRLIILRKSAVALSFPVFLLIARLFPFERLPSICAFYNFTGYPCATCGMTRSVVLLTHLDLHGAFSMNPLAPVVVLVFAVWWGIAVYQDIAGRQTSFALWVRKHAMPLVITGLGVLLVFGVVRIVLMSKGILRWAGSA